MKKIAVTPVGTAAGAEASASVPATGGTLVSTDGRLKVTVPAGALSASQVLTVQAISNQAPGGAGAAYRLGPEGTTFSQPVTLTFTYGAADTRGSDEAALSIAYQDSMGRWNSLTSVTRDTAAKTISGVTSHFSDWSMLKGWQLRPGAATVEPGATLKLTVDVCTDNVKGTDQLAFLRNECQPDTDFLKVSDWSVNGTPGGSAAVGTLSNTDDSHATFTAPGAQPSVNPVAVSGSGTLKAGTKSLLVSNVWIGGEPPLGGFVKATIRDATGLVLTSYTTVIYDYDPMLVSYTPRLGHIDVTYDIADSSCVTHATGTAGLTKSDGLLTVTGGIYIPSGSKPVDLVGTTTCGSTTDPAMVTRDVQWFPSVAGDVFQVLPDGDLVGGYPPRLEDSGETISAEWSLVSALP